MHDSWPLRGNTAFQSFAHFASFAVNPLVLSIYLKRFFRLVKLMNVFKISLDLWPKRGYIYFEQVQNYKQRIKDHAAR